GVLIGVGSGTVALAGHRHVLVPLAVIWAYVGIVGTVVSKKWSRLRNASDPLWSRFWQGRPGRLLARIASIRLGQRAVAANRPTELAIAMSAEAVFATLSKDLRQSLGDVPEALRGLEARA